jgi:hypothetical protein
MSVGLKSSSVLLIVHFILFLIVIHLVLLIFRDYCAGLLRQLGCSEGGDELR